CAPIVAVGRCGRVSTDRPVSLLMPWWLRRIGFAAAGPRILAVLRHHDAIDADLYCDGVIGHDRAFPKRYVDYLPPRLVARGDRPRNAVQRRATDHRGSELRKEARALVLRRDRDRARQHARHLRRVATLDDPQAEVERYGDAPATGLLVRA